MTDATKKHFEWAIQATERRAEGHEDAAVHVILRGSSEHTIFDRAEIALTQADKCRAIAAQLRTAAALRKWPEPAPELRVDVKMPPPPPPAPAPQKSTAEKLAAGSSVPELRQALAEMLARIGQLETAVTALAILAHTSGRG